MLTHHETTPWLLTCLLTRVGATRHRFCSNSFLSPCPHAHSAQHVFGAGEMQTQFLFSTVSLSGVLPMVYCLLLEDVVHVPRLPQPAHIFLLLSFCSNTADSSDLTQMHFISACGELSTRRSCRNGTITPITPSWARALLCNLYAYCLFVCLFFQCDHWI